VITDLFALGVLAAVILVLTRWRAGIFLAIVFGALQDPIRKLTPDTPAIMAITSIPIWSASCLIAFNRDRMWATFRKTWPRVASAMRLFLLSLIPATLIVFQYGLGAWRLATIGLFGYLMPMASLLAGFIYTTSRDELRRVLVFYCLFTAAMMSGSFLEYTGAAPGWAVLGTGAMNVRWVRYMGVEQVDLITGFYRSPDVMGWHAAALTMFAMTLQLDPACRRRRVWPLLAVIGIFALVMAGRRKMIAMPVLWCTFVLAYYFRSGRVSRALAILVAVVITVGAVYLAAGEVEIDENYYIYAASTTSDAAGRLLQDTWGALFNTFSESGPLGRGIGSASQGTQHVGLDQGRGWQESGLSKLAVELGLAGLVCAAALGLALLRGFGAVLRLAPRMPSAGAMHVALIGFVAANAVSFLISHQVYGDALVMILTAFVIGVVLSAPRWVPAQVQAPSAAAAPRLAQVTSR
jgi:hypothetical protein